MYSLVHMQEIRDHLVGDSSFSGRVGPGDQTQFSGLVASTF